MKKIVIVGAGISGLFFANLLRQRPEYEVTIFEKNDSVNFNEIIFYKNDKGESFVGSPLVEGLSVIAKVVDQIRDKKIIVFKKKRRHNYRRKIGHRQDLTLVKVEEIKMNKQSSDKSIKTDKTESNKASIKGDSNGP